MATIFDFAVPTDQVSALKINRYEKTFTARCSFISQPNTIADVGFVNGKTYKYILLFSVPIKSKTFKLKNLYIDGKFYAVIAINNVGGGGSVGWVMTDIIGIDYFTLSEKFLIGISDKANKAVDYTLAVAATDTSQSELNFYQDNTYIIDIQKYHFLQNSDIKIESIIKNQNIQSYLNIFLEIKPSFYSTTGQTGSFGHLGVIYDELVTAATAKYAGFVSAGLALTQDILITGEFLD